MTKFFAVERIAELRAELAEVRQARKEIISVGVSVSLSGSHSYTKADLPSLREEEARILRELALLLNAGELRTRREVPIYG